jgi:hypothetical protein
MPGGNDAFRRHKLSCLDENLQKAVRMNQAQTFTPIQIERWLKTQTAPEAQFLLSGILEMIRSGGDKISIEHHLCWRNGGNRTAYYIARISERNKLIKAAVIDVIRQVRNSGQKITVDDACRIVRFKLQTMKTRYNRIESGSVALHDTVDKHLFDACYYDKSTFDLADIKGIFEKTR